MPVSNVIEVPEELLSLRGINGYSVENAQRKDQFHRLGTVLLRSLADALGLSPDQYALRSNRGGMAVSGEVTLHADDIYIQLAEFAGTAGVKMLFRSCNHREDYCGHQNHYSSLTVLSLPEHGANVIARIRRLLEAERAAKRARLEALTI